MSFTLSKKYKLKFYLNNEYIRILTRFVKRIFDIEIVSKEIKNSSGLLESKVAIAVANRLWSSRDLDFNALRRSGLDLCEFGDGKGGPVVSLYVFGRPERLRSVGRIRSDKGARYPAKHRIA